MEPLSDFAVKTHAELLRLAGEARALDPTRGYETARRWNRLHDEINDFIDQLRGIDPDPIPLTPLQNALLADYATDNIADRTCEPICQCGRAKSVVGRIALMCVDCDAIPLPTLGLGGA